MENVLVGLIDIGNWVASLGLVVALIVIGILVFAESGLLIGVFLPGDSLLIACGIFAAQGDIPLLPVLAVTFVAAIIGDNTGYLFGRRAGPRLFKKRRSKIFRKEYLHRAEAYFESYGPKTVLFARFIPYVRTFTPIVAGISRMDRRRFVIYNIIGGLLWTVITILLGYWLGQRIPDLHDYLWPAIAFIMVAIFGPAAIHFLRVRQRRRTQ
jgi:membrane-associated protein